MEQGDWICVHCSLDARCRSTGESVAITGSAWASIEDGKIREAYHHFDFMSLWAQLGLLPNDVFEKRPARSKDRLRWPLSRKASK